MKLARIIVLVLTSSFLTTSCRASRPARGGAPAAVARPRDDGAVLRVSSFSFTSSDDELLPLAGWIGDAEMVLLGEAHHGDAEGIAATVRLIRFLHERVGFDLLALEADLYGCARAWEGVRRGEPDATRLCTFQKDSLGRAAAQFWPYVAERARTQRPLVLSGFDCQPASEGSRRLLRDELKQVVGPHLAPATWRRAAETIEKLSRYTPRESEAERREDRAALSALARALTELEPSGSLDPARLSLLRQLGRSLVADEAQEWEYQQSQPLGPGYHRSFNARDAQMAENLLWLRAQHPGRKLVVWAATAHLVRSLASIPTDPPAEAPRFVPMGKHVARALGRRAVHIGVLHASGTVGSPGAAPFPLPPAPTGFLEDELERRGFGARSLIDLRRPSSETRWLEQPRPARWYLTKRTPTTVAERPRDVVDIILYLEKTRPNVASTPDGQTGAP